MIAAATNWGSSLADELVDKGLFSGQVMKAEIPLLLAPACHRDPRRTVHYG